VFKDVQFLRSLGSPKVGSLVKKDSLKECSDYCDSQPKCYAWSYYTEQYTEAYSHKNCYLNDASFKDRQRKYLGITSGIKGCGKGKSMKT
jgi:hypothetical protein